MKKKMVTRERATSKNEQTMIVLEPGRRQT